MQLYLALFACNGKEYLGYTVADVIAYYILGKKQGYQDAHGWKNEIQPVGVHITEIVGEQVLDFVYYPFQHYACKGGAYTDDEGDEKHEPFVGESLAVFPAPPK